MPDSAALEDTRLARPVMGVVGRPDVRRLGARRRRCHVRQVPGGASALDGGRIGAPVHRRRDRTARVTGRSHGVRVHDLARSELRLAEGRLRLHHRTRARCARRCSGDVAATPIRSSMDRAGRDGRFDRPTRTLGVPRVSVRDRPQRGDPRLRAGGRLLVDDRAGDRQLVVRRRYRRHRRCTGRRRPRKWSNHMAPPPCSERGSNPMSVCAGRYVVARG